MKRANHRIFLSGGGTAGSVSPLLAVAEHLHGYDLFFVGTAHGVERDLVGKRMPYLSIPAGKLRRYSSWRNITDVANIIYAFFYSLILLVRYRPSAVITAGSFVAVPLVWAAWCVGIRTVVHQQDLQVGLATRLTQPFASVLTKAFVEIPLHNAEVVGNPVRDLTPTTQDFTLDTTVPTILVFGGGTGAQAINELVSKELCDLANVIHVTGPNKNTSHISHPRYHVFELLNESMKEALAKADLVIARAGLSTISELSILTKPAIIIPMPNSHQEVNAKFLDKHSAAFILQQHQITPASLVRDCEMLLHNPEQLEYFSKNISSIMPHTAAEQLAQKIRKPQ